MSPLHPRSQSPPASVSSENTEIAVLVVDDNDAKRLALKAALSPLGHPVVEADSGRAALRCLMERDFAVILLDVQMPGMDGFETAALIRLRSQNEMTPIIFVTAHASDEIDRYAAGAVDFITAPIVARELRAKVSVFANLSIRARTLADRAQEVQASADQLSLARRRRPDRDLPDRRRGSIHLHQPAVERDHRHRPQRRDGREMGHDHRVRPACRPRHRARRSWRRSHRSWTSLRDPPSRLGPADRAGDLDDRFTAATAEVAGWVGTLADITAEAGAEAAMSEARDKATEASRLKSDFLANMSHEIRTPMNGVIGMTDLLLETDLDDRQRDYALTVRNSGEALLTIINDILDFSKVEAGKLEIEDIDFELRTVVDDVVDLLTGSAQTKELEFTTVIEDSIPAFVCGDPGRVRQVLTNLIGNAIKFTQTGEIVVRVILAEAVGTDVLIRFEVSDTGDGIAADKLETVFQPFVQADTSTSRKYGGTGLGLAISSQLVTLMGGDSGVSSQLGEGSTFWFTIRVAINPRQSQVARPELAREPRQVTAPAGELHTGRLLLAEDNLINQKVAVAMLSGAGYTVDTVLNGAAAVQAVSVQSYDTILMDCQMPEMNGYEATAAIRAYEGPTQHTPIIAMTAGARAEDRATCLAQGMDGYLSKPVNKDALLALVARSTAPASDADDGDLVSASAAP